MKSKIILGLIVLAFGLFISSQFFMLFINTETKNENKEETKTELKMASDFSLKDKNAELVKLSNFKGKTIFLNFWATWCHACESEMEHIESLYHDYGENKKDVVFLTVVLPNGKDDITSEELRSFIKNKGYNFPILFDENGEIFRNYGVHALPTTYMITREGQLYGYVPGAMNEKLMKQVIEEVKKV